MEDSFDRMRPACLDIPLGKCDRGRRGEQRALDDLDEAWRAHAEEIRRRCRVWMGGNADEAHEAFSRAWSRAVASYVAARPTLVNPRAWLLTLAYRACMDLHRERARRGEEELDVTRPAAASSLAQIVATPRDPEGLALGRELTGVLLTAIDGLPVRLRSALHTYMGSGSYSDLVERFGITNENARKRIQQARAILRKRLLDYRTGHRPGSRGRGGCDG
jgi:RNA polymerase sigma factor (sigma-70 family)